jgi:hypothetical protein
MKTKECCKTCRHHTVILVRVDEFEGEECPVFDHYCDGKRINGSTASDFRCGRYEGRAML